MTTHPLEVHHGYLLASAEDRRWLVDTGCPMSIGEGTTRIGGRPRVLARPVAGFGPEALTGLAGVEVAGILGADVLLEAGCRIDLPGGVLVLAPRERLGRPVACGSRNLLGTAVPAVSATLDGRGATLAFDTGAPLGYLPRGRGAARSGTGLRRRDYLAVAQQWHETEVWSLPLGLGGQEEALHWGELPDRLDALFALTGMDGIFGGELCLAHAVTVGPRGEGLWIA